MSIEERKEHMNFITAKFYPHIYEALKRDNYTCQHCGSSRLFNKFGQRILIVHHLDDSRKTGNLNNDISNLVTLCKKCHGNIHLNNKERENVESRRGMVLELRENGLSFTEIGKKLGVSRQRAQQISVGKN
jgi:transposase-like protein